MPPIETPAAGAPGAARREPEGAPRSIAIDAMLEASPLDREGELARQLSEVLRKPVKRTGPAHTEPVQPSAWETEDAPVAITEAQVTGVADSDPRRLRRLHVRRASDTRAQVTGEADGGPEAAVEDSTEPDGAALPPKASAWIEAARRERARAILKGAAGWMISVAASVAIIAAAAWILLGRPTDLEALLEQALQVLDLG